MLIRIRDYTEPPRDGLFNIEQMIFDPIRYSNVDS
jgi:hypothetical protein